MEEKVYTIISQTLGVSKDSINDEDKLVDLAADSIKLFELLIALEKAFDQEVDYRDVADIETVGQILTYIKKLGF